VAPSLIKESEANFQARIIQLARIGGWLVHAERPAWSAKGYRTPIQGNAGFPDLVLCHPQRKQFLMVELKSGKGSLRPEQETWGAALVKSGVTYHCWRPSDWDRIVKTLGLKEV
jgi:hypothetical protein